MNIYVFLESCGCRLPAADEAYAVAAMLRSFHPFRTRIPMCWASKAVMEASGAIPGHLYGTPEPWYLGNVRRRWEALP